MALCSRSVKEATKVESESTMEGPNWLELPRDITAKILQKLGAIEIVMSARLVCPLWWNICKDPFMWRTIDMHNPGTSPHFYLRKICIYAVHQSCGNVEDINIEYFGTNPLLKYIADRASHLRRMRLFKLRWVILNKGLREAAKKLPLLEELEISFCIVSTKSLLVIGQYCPLLKVFKFNMNVKCIEFECDDDEAFVIAKTMSELRHLQLRGNSLTNDGLLAILDGCPHLESLDLRACFNLDLKGSLGERCDKQIKDLQFPDDYLSEISDYDDGYEIP